MNNKKNKTSFAKGHQPNQEIKNKISLANKGHIPWNKGNKAYTRICLYCGKEFNTSKSYQKYCCINCARKRPYPLKGKKMSLESRKNMSVSKLGKYQKLAESPEIVNNKGYVYKYAGKKKYLVSHLVWCKANNCKEVPNGCVIHHIDHNPKNNSIDNLMLLDRATHCKVHKKDIYIGRWVK